jgi:feruloyl esterase
VVTDYDAPVAQNGVASTTGNNIKGLNFCNVTVTYEHPGKNDEIHVSVWLPNSDKWNGRFQGTGGGGWVMGSGADVLAPAINLNYAAANTDGGLPTTGDISSWATISEGNVNLYALDTFASTGLDDLAKFGKLVTTAYYGEAPKYSYWNGCSTGGRQGYMQAQRYPDNYDGILANAPAINWHKFIPAEFWPVVVMNQVGYFPPTCEFAEINALLIDACDELDGVKDGIVTNPYQCTYNITEAVGKTFSCNGTQRAVSEKTVEIVEKIWEGSADMETEESLWFGLNMATSFVGIADTTCDANNTICSSTPFNTSMQWFDYFLHHGEDIDFMNMTYQEYAGAFHRSVQRYESIIGTDDTDLSEFKAGGKKLLTWHGLSDQLIFPNGTINYYNDVAALNSDIDDFYRFFTVPGVQHCGNGDGALPDDDLGALVNWVENGVAPDILVATSQVSNDTKRTLCPYPKMQTYLGGDVDSASSFGCV